MRFLNKRVLITGASRGIGREIAQAFREEGAWVIGTRTKHPIDCDSFCDEWISADFSNLEQIYACSGLIRNLKIDVLVNNAGINKNASFIEIDSADFLRIQQVNVFAPFIFCQAAIPFMRSKNWGRIVNLSSIWGKISKKYRASYSASKFALDGLTVALAAEHAADGIIANSVSPGFIDTDLTRSTLNEIELEALISQVPLKRLGRVDEIAKLVLWLSSNENTFIVGQNISIDGGFTRA